ncbi:MAG: bifunctional glutamate N-acetyltransferase/amino-acid acetyltransferase ArgJ [Candidatus Omnitrophica bacterium]|nr:bifunctional glutamate N-acetyltransferase/amino-acid acetyltransferase ArgJ [Candidatus Omnitrophota bacterium]
MIISKKAILPLGFKAGAVSCGLKKSGKPDLALFYSQVPAKAACLFTANKIQAAPIKVSKRHLAAHKEFRAIIVNSGNANAFTGNKGIIDANTTAESLAAVLGIEKKSILVGSTGIIGRRLEVSKIKSRLPELVSGLSEQGINNAKRAIMTTDTFTKEITVRFAIGKQKVTLCGIAKGAGMIAPELATMLVFIFSDANISAGALERALQEAAESSFNCISVDGCMSTNDSVFLLANGASGCALIDNQKNFNLFSNALNKVCLELAKLIIRDAEGATKFIKIQVGRAKNYAQAKKAALAIANSVLFKTAIYGENPNFGRIVAAIGSSGIEVREKDLNIRLSSLNKREINVYVSLQRGKASATVYTSDLTPEYVKINAEYN